jgi:hypothetical protein
MRGGQAAPPTRGIFVSAIALTAYPKTLTLPKKRATIILNIRSGLA